MEDMLSKALTQKQKTMEETISLIFHGCNLARDLESNLPNLANQPNILSKSCNEITQIFRNARDRLNADPMSLGHMIFHGLHQPGELDQIGEGVQEWVKYDGSQAMNIFHGQFLAEKSSTEFEAHRMHERNISTGLERRGSGFQVPVEAPMQLRGSGGEVQPSDSAGDSSTQRRRRRNVDTEKRIVKVPAPQMGNIEIPPEDGFIWKKYGQKDIFGSRFPRSYYKCTHQKQFHCPAKKQVQRLENDPYTLEVTYKGEHTCHNMLSPAPRTPPPMSTEFTRRTTPKTATTQPISPPSAPMPLSRWTSTVDSKPRGDSTISTFINTQMQMHRSFGLSSDIAGPSNVEYGRVVDYQQPVTDLVDAMFNSGSCSNNIMEDIIFSSMESKWEGADNKK
ncbi:WRKY transcription factor 55-like [Cornus florida]|uniref:WRKY transcription factor 55-like n=1 Tax=Cornus florida TaxID=4283 RepID=UPI00289E3E1E|nr:WRKY transcription factor 55-like [Cornus florida]